MRAVVALAVLLEGAVAFSTLPALPRETARFVVSDSGPCSPRTRPRPSACVSPCISCRRRPPMT